MFAALSAAALTALTMFSPVGYHDDVPPPTGKITIDVATVNGSGCPAGTAAIAVSPDNTSFTVSYSDYLAKVGPGADPTAFRKNCQLNLIVNIPQGFTYGIASADYRGFAHLEPGATGLEKASYYFQGMSETGRFQTPFSGPLSDNWQVTDSTEIGAIVYKPCGEQRNFNINTELRVDAGTSDPSKTSFMSMDSTDGNIDTTYHFQWKECPKP
ncbi:DUF4360 domain-containing protein [Saccharopolyspora elongata]|uniref:DUF4360 domain-containing protein n=1 Tax=Saccharopolyspora elongata TaxID=2530387 RepID=A0A4R4YZ09_9PSEU|nr:DUF4360 domain-containing protein [Saccharopolyspora elongata]